MQKLVIAALILLILLLYASGRGVIAQDRELHFYQNNPPCTNAEITYLEFVGKRSELHRVYVCGYKR